MLELAKCRVAQVGWVTQVAPIGRSVSSVEAYVKYSFFKTNSSPPTVLRDFISTKHELYVVN